MIIYKYIFTNTYMRQPSEEIYSNFKAHFFFEIMAQ